jgi:hypothetical protein
MGDTPCVLYRSSLWEVSAIQGRSMVTPRQLHHLAAALAPAALLIVGACRPAESGLPPMAPFTAEQLSKLTLDAGLHDAVYGTACTWPDPEALGALMDWEMTPEQVQAALQEAGLPHAPEAGFAARRSIDFEVDGWLGTRWFEFSRRKAPRVRPSLTLASGPTCADEATAHEILDELRRIRGEENEHQWHGSLIWYGDHGAERFVNVTEGAFRQDGHWFARTVLGGPDRRRRQRLDHDAVSSLRWSMNPHRVHRVLRSNGLCTSGLHDLRPSQDAGCGVRALSWVVDCDRDTFEPPSFDGCYPEYMRFEGDGVSGTLMLEADHIRNVSIRGPVDIEDEVAAEAWLAEAEQPYGPPEVTGRTTTWWWTDAEPAIALQWRRGGQAGERFLSIELGPEGSHPDVLTVAEPNVVNRDVW